MKALLFTLLRAYRFELAVAKEDIMFKKGYPVQKPVVRGSKGDNEMPMYISPIL